VVLERGDGTEALLDLLRGVLDFVLPKERVFWEPFGAGPLDVRERRVGGMVTDFLFSS